jgi:preprotein translocase subunit SecD
MRCTLNFFCLAIFLISSSAKAETIKYFLEHTGQEGKTAKIISNRLNHAKSFFDAKVEVINDKGSIYLLVDANIAESDYFEYLVSNRGKLEAFTIKKSKRDVWFTEANITNTGFSETNVDLSVTGETVPVTNELFTKNKGQLITILLDGELLLKAKLSRPLGKHFRINPVTIAKPEYVAILLKYGSFAERVHLTKAQ